MLNTVPQQAKVWSVTLGAILALAGCDGTGAFPQLRPVDMAQYDQLRLDAIEQKQFFAKAYAQETPPSSVQDFGQEFGATGSENRIATLYFTTGNAQLGAKEKQLLSSIVKQLQENELALLMVGHSSFYLEHSNRAVDATISFKRVKAVYDYLLQQGVESYGLNMIDKRHTKPRYSPINKAGQISNQRVEIFVLDETKN